MNRWKLKDEIKLKYMPIVKKFIEGVEKVDIENSDELLKKDFSDTELNPYTLGIILENLGYERNNQDDNGWELDFWITYTKKGYRPIMINGCGMTFELQLSEVEE